jgi:hypothetical protein
MLLPSPEALQSRRSQPPEWEGLLATASGAIDSDGEYTPNGVAELWHEVDQLDQTRLDANRYFALGHIICEFAQKLQPIMEDEAQTEELVSYGATLMLLGSEEREPPRTNHVRLWDAAPIFIATFRSSASNTPQPNRLLGNALTVSDQIRLPLSEAPSAKTSIHKLLDRSKNPMWDEVEADMIGGMSIIQALAERWAGRPLNRLSPHQRQELFDRLRQPDVLKQARGFSTTPMVAFDPAELLKTYTGLVTKTIEPIDWPAERQRQAVTIQRLRQDERYNAHNLRTERLVCPAATVPMMFPMMQELTIRMLEEAHR